jgi:hypothetical protein
MYIDMSIQSLAIIATTVIAVSVIKSIWENKTNE